MALFATPIGRCAIAWLERGIAAVQLPAADDAATRARARHHLPTARLPATGPAVADDAGPPPPVRAAIGGIRALLDGGAVDLGFVELDFERVPAFHRRVYEVARTIPAGTTVTYGEVAARLGEPGAARAVGQALGRNPFAIVVPCHRVLAAGGRLGGFSARGGVATKRRLLSIEGAPAVAEGTLF